MDTKQKHQSLQRGLLLPFSSAVGHTLGHAMTGAFGGGGQSEAPKPDVTYQVSRELVKTNTE